VHTCQMSGENVSYGVAKVHGGAALPAEP